jgi:hypothetical protein
MLGSLPNPQESRIIPIPDKLSKLYIDTHNILQQYKDTTAPLLAKEIIRISTNLDFVFENLSIADEESKIEYCIRLYEYYYKLLSYYDSLFLSDEVEKHLTVEAEKERLFTIERQAERKLRDALVEQEKILLGWF